MDTTQVAGWYPDPRNPSQNIYWDGATWLGAPPIARPRSKAAQLRQVAGLIAVLLILAFVFWIQKDYSH